MIETILAGLIRANLAAGAAVLVVLAIRKLVRPRFGARAAYALWLAPLAAGLAALPPHAAGPSLITPMMQSAAFTADDFVAAAAPAASGPDLASIALAVWLTGMAAAVLLVAWRQGRFLRAMGRLEPGAEPGVFRAQNADVGPAVVGTLRARIVTPADFETRFAPAERALILAHERVHLAGGDASANALACAVQCLCWFNPLVHLGARLARIDQELACDAAVIDQRPDARRAYGELLLKTQLFTQALPLGCHWPAPAEHPLKERIAMLKSPPPERAMRVAGLLVAASLGLGAGGLAWAAQPTAGTGPGPSQRAEALKQLAARPGYSCDPALEAKGVGCKIVPTSAWLALPTPADVARAYPPGAREAGQTAKVQLTCKTTVKGLMKDCAVVHVNLHVPQGEGAPPSALNDFGNAALRLTRYYQANIPSMAGMPTKEGSATFLVEIGEFHGAVTPVGDLPPAPTARGHAKTLVSDGPGSYVPPPNFAEPKTNGQSPQAAFHSIWIKKPTGDDMVRLYPAEAVAKGLTGDVVMSCKVGSDGRLNRCAIDRADVSGGSGPPPATDPGFGAATLELAKLFQMESTSPQGAPTTGTVVRIPVRFMLPTPQPTPPT